MNNKSKMETLYENYLLLDDKTIFINNRTYYKIIHKELIQLKDKNVFVITLPSDLINCRSAEYFEDENGNTFKFSVVHIAFNGVLPEWYRNTITFQVNFTTINELGNYVSVVK